MIIRRRRRRCKGIHFGLQRILATPKRKGRLVEFLLVSIISIWVFMWVLVG